MSAVPACKIFPHVMKKTGMIILRAPEEPLRQIVEDVDAEDSVFKIPLPFGKGIFSWRRKCHLIKNKENRRENRIDFILIV